MREATLVQNGHTLSELLAALLIVAILVAAAAPSFAGWLLDLRRDAAVTASLHALHLARQLAALRHEAVSVCGTRGDLLCSGRTDWSAGLMIAADGGQMRRELPVGPAVLLHSNRTAIRFEAGTGYATPATLSVCDRRGPSSARTVIVSRSGRPRATGPGEGRPSC